MPEADARREGDETQTESVKLQRIAAEGSAHQFIVGSGSLAVQTMLPAPRVPVPRQLPSDVAAFVGRTGEIERLDRILNSTGQCAAPNSVLIGGTAGVGKTGLAIRWGHRVREQFPDGDLYIDLRGYGPDQPIEPMDALAHLLSSFGLRESELPQRLAERATYFRSLVYGKRMLIVLDNASSIEQIRELMPGSSSCAVLVTSRDRLDGVTARYGIPRLTLDLLEPEDAMQLLVDIIGERARDAPDAARSLAEVCGHHTLALRIAATNAANQTAALADLVTDLRSAFEHNDLAPLSTGDDPHTDLRAVYSWSLEHLSKGARRAFALIGLCPAGSSDLYGLAGLLHTDLSETRSLAHELVRAHLLAVNESDRFVMHDLLRAYARRVAEDQIGIDERNSAINGYLAYHAHTASRAMDHYIPFERPLRPDPPQGAITAPEFKDDAAAIDWLNSERMNLIATALYAAEHGRPDHTCHIAFTIFRYLSTCGNLHHNLQLQASAFSCATKPSQRGRALEYQSVGLLRMARHEEAGECLRRAIDLARQVDDVPLEAANIANLGHLYTRMDRWEDGIECLERALEMMLRTGIDSEITRVRCLLAEALTVVDRTSEAAEQLEIALKSCQASGFAHREARLLQRIGVLRLRTGEPAAALEMLTASRSIFDRIGNHSHIQEVTNDIGSAYRALGLLVEAETHHRQALVMARSTSIVDSEVMILNDLGITLRKQGRLPEALETFRQVIELAKYNGFQFQHKRAIEQMTAIAHLP
ncbi:tetratricopeptide repeat protein [Glycomyces sp. NPDC047369]